MPDTLYYPIWMRSSEAMMNVYRTAWEDTGDLMLALEEVRALPEYDQKFAGNKRADGSVRYDENTYLSVYESYEDILLSINVNPDLFQSKFAELIANEVSPGEFGQRVDSLYTRVIDQAPAISAYYDTNFGTEMSTSGIMASLMDPTIGQQIINKQIAMSEVGGNAAMRNFTVGVDFANQLVNAGLDTNSEAAQFFSLAEGMLPTLQVLTARHMDPNDEFNLEDFAQAEVFGNADMRRRIRTMQAAERTDFGGTGVRTDQTGVSGLFDT